MSNQEENATPAIATPAATDDARAALTTRSIPHMAFSTGAPESKTPAPVSASASTGLSPAEQAAARFAIDGPAIFTGGSGTLALATALAFIQHACPALTLLDLSFSPSSLTTISTLRTSFPAVKILTLNVDVTDAVAVDEAIATASRDMGGVSVLITFAGVVSCVHALDMEAQEWRRVMDVNATGTFLAARGVAREMVRLSSSSEEENRAMGEEGEEKRKGGGGSITFIASISASKTNFPQPQAAYNASKAAVVSLAKSLAAEWAVHGIRVNVVSPGYLDTVLNEGNGLEEARNIWTSRNPMGRMGKVEEVVGILVLLASKGAGSYVTGSEIRVDGGQSVI